MKITGFTIERFRCFEGASIDDVGHVNVIVGPNNVGKTALLLPLRRLTRLDAEFVPRQATPGGVAYFAPEHFFAFFPQDHREREEAPRLTLSLEGQERMFDLGNSDSRVCRGVCLEAGEGRGDWVIRWQDETQTPTRKKGAVLGTINALARRIVHVPSSRVGLWRQPDRDEANFREERSYDGSSLYADLLRWVLPKRESGTPDPSSAERVRRLSAFVSHVLGETSEIWPSSTRGEVMIRLAGGPARPLREVGEGVAHAVVIGAALHGVDQPIIIIEEPEIGLHPMLQRRLVDALLRVEDCMAFMTTHSNHIMDIVHDDVRLYRVSADGEGRRTVTSAPPRDRRALAEIGVRPSSISSANCVIWVEGPSDAIYLRAFLKELAPGLEEWRDFAFSFFGGALLEHLAVEEHPNRLVSIVSLNPAWYLVADSDRKSKDAALGKKYLERFQATVPDPSRIWITQSREVEGYVDDATFVATLGAPDAVSPTPGTVASPFVPLSERLRSLGLPSSKAKKKVTLADRLVQQWRANPAWPLDLRDRVGRLAAFIQECREALPAHA